MEDNGKYTGRTSKVLAFLFGIMTLLYLFRSPIQDLICKNVSLGQRKLPPERDSVYFDEDPLKTSNRGITFFICSSYVPKKTKQELSKMRKESLTRERMQEMQEFLKKESEESFKEYLKD